MKIFYQTSKLIVAAPQHEYVLSFHAVLSCDYTSVKFNASEVPVKGQRSSPNFSTWIVHS